MCFDYISLEQLIFTDFRGFQLSTWSTLVTVFLIGEITNEERFSHPKGPWRISLKKRHFHWLGLQFAKTFVIFDCFHTFGMRLVKEICDFHRFGMKFVSEFVAFHDFDRFKL